MFSPVYGIVESRGGIRRNSKHRPRSEREGSRFLFTMGNSMFHSGGRMKGCNADGFGSGELIDDRCEP